MCKFRYSVSLKLLKLVLDNYIFYILVRIPYVHVHLPLDPLMPFDPCICVRVFCFLTLVNRWATRVTNKNLSHLVGVDIRKGDISPDLRYVLKNACVHVAEIIDQFYYVVQSVFVCL